MRVRHWLRNQGFAEVGARQNLEHLSCCQAVRAHGDQSGNLAREPLVKLPGHRLNICRGQRHGAG